MSEPTSTTPAYPPRDLTSPQLTVRAVATGMVLGGLLSLCNIYVSLQIGWSTNMSVTGVLLAWALWKAIDTVTKSTKPFGILENNINQTACSAAAAVSSAGLVAPIPALALLTGTELSYPQLAFWVFSVCLVGIAAAIAIRRQMIIVDQLPFPGGLATAHTLKEVYGTGADAMKRVAMLGVGALAAGLVKVVALTKLLGHLAFPGKLAGHKLGDLGFELDQSLLMVGVGGLVGTRGAWSMLLGGVLAWGVVAPWALNQGYVELKTNETLTALPEGVTLSPTGRLQYQPARKLLELRGPLGESERDAFLAMSADPAWRAAVTKLAIESERTYMSSESAERFERVKAAGDWMTVVRVPDAARAALGAEATLPTNIAERVRLEDGHLHVRGAISAEHAAALASALIRTDADAASASALRGFLGQIPTFSELRPVKANFTDVLAWLLWPGVTLMVVSSLVSFSFSWRSIARAFRGGGESGEASDSGDMPFRWYTKLALVAAALSIVAQVVLFGIAWWAAALGVVLSVVLAVVAARVSGETNNTPIGAMGKVTQLTFGAVLPADPAANLMTANVTGGAASQAADLMHDMKTGALIGATPWKQAIAQIFGALAGALAGSAIYLLLIPDPHTQLLTPKWPAPAVATWKAVAELFQRGFSALPEGIPTAMIIAGIVGVILPCLDRFAPARIKPWVPSAASLGLSFVVEAKNAISIFIGGMIALALGKAVPNWTARFLVTLASGLIVGDALVGAASAVATVLQGLWAT